MKKSKIEQEFEEKKNNILTEKEIAEKYSNRDKLLTFMEIWEQKIYELGNKLTKSTDLKRYGDAVTQYGNFRMKILEKGLEKNNSELDNYEFEELKEDSNNVNTKSD